MKLYNILKEIDAILIGDANTEILGLCYDSRKVKNGDLFFCISGFETDGHKYAASAVEKGASALVVTRKLDIDIAQIIVSDDRKAMANISAAFYGNPQNKMKMIGITGTNGKTTTTYMLKRIAEAAGHKVGIVGTIANIIGDEKIDAERTTPESPDLFKLLYEMHEKGCTLVAMEVSSHSLDLRRVDGIKFDVGIFTNLTQDHLDYHKTIEEYAKAKKKLFSMCKTAVANTDDGYGKYMIEECCDSHAFGIDNNQEFCAENIALSSNGAQYILNYNGNKKHVKINIPGRFSVYNSLGSIAAMYLLGIDLDIIIESLADFRGVPGRFEVLDNGGNDFTIVLDYAHTPDSLENILSTAKGFAKGRIVAVFGCGGDRDNKKRPIMGEISGNMSDFTIITSDNPRTEDPAAIIGQIEEGIKRTSGKYITIQSRKDAIFYALKNAQKDDFIILAGKGHETYQEINHIKHHFDEKEVVAELLKEI